MKKFGRKMLKKLKKKQKKNKEDFKSNIAAIKNNKPRKILMNSVERLQKKRIDLCSKTNK